MPIRPAPVPGLAAGLATRPQPVRRHARLKSRHSVHGMAIAVIITAVALAVLIGVALTLAARAGASMSESNHQAVVATILLEQAATIKTALEGTQAKNEGYFNLLDLSSNRNDRSEEGVYHPVDGMTAPQNPPGEAFTAGTGNWAFYPSNGRSAYTIYLNGVGTASGTDSVIVLSGLTQGVCQQINKLVTGSITIPATSVAVNFSNATTDLRGEASLSGLYEICFKDSNNLYQYYRVVLAG